MAFETKVLLVSLAEHAIVANSKYMYDTIAKMANVEGVVLQPFEEAKAANTVPLREAEKG